MTVKQKFLNSFLIMMLSVQPLLVVAQVDDGSTGDIDTGESSDVEVPTTGDTPTYEEPSEEIPTYEEPSEEIPTYTEPIYEEPVEELDVTSGNVIEVTETTEEVNVDLDQLMLTSLSNAVMTKAYEDYQFALENFTLNDEVQDELIGSPLEEVKSQFMTYLEENVSEEAEVSDKAKEETFGEAQSLTYLYYYPGEAGNEERSIAELTFHFDKEQLTAISLINKAPIISRLLSDQDLADLPGQSLAAEFLASRQVTMVGVIAKVSNEFKYYTFIAPSKRDKTDLLNFIEVSHEFGKVGKVIEEDAKTDVSLEVINYLNEKEPRATLNKDYIAESTTSESTEEGQSSEAESESSAESTNENSELSMTEEKKETTLEASTSANDSTETTEASETTVLSSEETSKSTAEAMPDLENNEVLNKLPLSFDYNAEKLNDQTKMVKGFETLLKDAQEGKTLTADNIDQALGEPNSLSGENDEQRLYLSVTDSEVIIINVTLDEQKQVVSMKNEFRDLEVLGTFPITLDELYEIGQDEKQIVSHLETKIGNPTIVEYNTAKQSVRFVWTRLQDKAIKNIEVEQNLKDGSQGLMYYEP